VEARKSSVLLVLVLFVGCASARPIVPVSETLETSTPMLVERNRSGLGPKPLRFGEWQVNGFDRKGLPSSRKRSAGNAHVSYSQTNAFAAYSFRLTPATRDEWTCDCEFRRKEQSAGLGSPSDALEVQLTYEDSFRCDLLRAGDTEPWKLEVYGSLRIGGEGYSGTLSRGSRSLTLEPSHQIRGLPRVPSPPFGYVFLREGRELANVELIHPGFVRVLDEAGADRDLIAAAAASLLLNPSGF